MLIITKREANKILNAKITKTALIPGLKSGVFNRAVFGMKNKIFYPKIISSLKQCGFSNVLYKPDSSGIKAQKS